MDGAVPATPQQRLLQSETAKNTGSKPLGVLQQGSAHAVPSSCTAAATASVGQNNDRTLVVSSSLPTLPQTGTSTTRSPPLDQKTNGPRVAAAPQGLSPSGSLPVISIISPRSRKMYDRLPKPNEAEQQRMDEFEHLFQNVDILDAYKLCRKNVKSRNASKRNSVLVHSKQGSASQAKKARLHTHQGSKEFGLLDASKAEKQNNNDADQGLRGGDLSGRRCESAPALSEIDKPQMALGPAPLSSIFGFEQVLGGQQEDAQQAVQVGSTAVSNPSGDGGACEDPISHLLAASPADVRPSTCQPLQTGEKLLALSNHFDTTLTDERPSTCQPLIPGSARSLRHTFQSIKQKTGPLGPNPHQTENNIPGNSSFVLSSLCKNDEFCLRRLESERIKTLNNIEGETKGVWESHGNHLLSTESGLRSEMHLSQTKQAKQVENIDLHIERAKSTLPKQFLFDYKLNQFQQERGLATLNSIVARIVNAELLGALEIWKVWCPIFLYDNFFLPSPLHYEHLW
jgi:hypothetical protein